MPCTYIYKGHVFNSEIELDDFLIEKRPFEPILGDVVFSQTNAQNNTESIIVQISEDSNELKKKYREWRALNKIKYGEDGEETIENPPYIGVNKFLSGLTNEAGELLFPEFREDEYWERRFNSWKAGDFNDAEIELFELDKNNLPNLTDIELAKKLRDKMKHKWEILAKTGTAIHNVLLLCFTKQLSKYAYEMSDNDLYNFVKSKIESENNQFLNEKAIKDAISHAKNLRLELENKFGLNLSYYPEFVISQQANIVEPTTLLGIIDLLIVDSTGNVHILDYKTSIHNYTEFTNAKKNSYSYLLATYQRMLSKYGINVRDGQLLVAPILITNFRSDGHNFIYDGINVDLDLVTLNTSLNSQKMWDNIDEFMPQPFKISVTGEEIGRNVTEMMSKWFPDYSSSRKITKETIIEELKKYDLLKKNDNGLFMYHKYGTKEPPITDSDEVSFIEKVVKYRESLPSKRLRFTASVKASIKDAIKNGIDAADFPSSNVNNEKSSTTWLKDQLSKYADGIWEVADKSTDPNLNSDIWEDYGLIMMKTKDIPGIAPQIDFIRVSTNTLDIYYRKYLKSDSTFKHRLGLTGTFETDITERSKSNSLMLLATNGNIEMMETMLIINLLTGLEGYPIGEILIVNPYLGNGMSASNEELLYCFLQLNKHESVTNNKFSKGEITFATKFEIARQKFNHIMIAAELNQYKDEYVKVKSLKSSTSVLDKAINGNSEEKIKALKELLNKLLQDLVRLKDLLLGTYSTRSNAQLLYIDLYNNILIAISKLKGVNFRQQLQNHDKWLESIFVHSEGVSGSYIDNPGNLNSETLNLVTKLVTEAYLNTRDDIQRDRSTIYKLVEKLKKSKGMSTLSENTIGNLVSLYSNMYEVTSDGDFLFKNPNTISNSAEREFLEYALDRINRNRFCDMTEEELKKMKDTNDIRYYRVPLAYGGSDSISSTRGLLSMLKNKLQYLYPTTAFERARAKVEGVFNAEEDTESQYKSQLLYKMTNLFDGGEDSKTRLDKINSEGIDKFEHNLESLLYKHLFAYSVLRNLDGVFPMIKASMIHILNLGIMRNTQFSDDILYLNEYIKNKILNQSIVDPKRLKAVNSLNIIKQAASKLTLALAPVQAIYLPLLGLWNDISLLIRKPDGKNSFTKDHFLKSLKLAYSDLTHFSDKPTLCQLLNETYGINDMDMNTYTERISTAKKGIWNMDNFLFKFAARPDFYNRMTIFLSLMMGDDCLEAHSVKNEKLIYDISKDKRFSEWWKNKTGNTPTINELRSLYYSIAKLFVIEHAKNPDGSEFELDMSNPQPLPRAYTNKDAESMKSLGDDIYGYYSHEKKSLIMSTMLGSMWLLFKTYWSGKKNQYLQSGGVRLRGKWIHYLENDKKFYYQVDNNGNILYDKEPLPEDHENLTSTIAPFMQWDGLWQEGIILTLSDMAKDMWNQKSFSKGWNNKWNNEDEKLQLAYRNNIKQLGYDMFMFLIISNLLGYLLDAWLEGLKKENKKDHNFFNGLAVAAANVSVMSVKNSFLDFNFIETVGSPTGQWTPFALEWGHRTMSNWWNVAMGDLDFWDGVVNTSGALKQIKPALDSIKPDIFRTKQEGGTFGVDD